MTRPTAEMASEHRSRPGGGDSLSREGAFRRYPHSSLRRGIPCGGRRFPKPRAKKKQAKGVEMKKECIAMLLAGGQGSRLSVLTGAMAKPAVRFGGKYPIIDFPLSSCGNSGIDTVGVLTHYRPLELNSYIGSGVQPWDLDGSNGGPHPATLPEQQGGTWYQGYSQRHLSEYRFFDLYDPDYVVILSGDHIYKMDYSDKVARHKGSRRRLPISVMEVPWEEASRFGIMTVN